jgi:hypothetical protein
LNLWDAIKGLFGNPAANAARNFTGKRSPSNAVIFFEIVDVGALVAVVALTKDNPNAMPIAMPIAWMLFALAFFVPIGTWIFYALNPHEPLTGPTLAAYLQQLNAARLAGKDHPVIEHVAGPPVRDPVALEAENKSGEGGGQ